MRYKKIWDSKRFPYWVMGYGGLIILGGVIGYLKASSTVSLVGGIGSGLWIVSAAIGMWQGRRGAFWFSGIGLVIAVAVFGYRLLLTGKWIPFGLLGILGILLLVPLISCIRKFYLSST